MNIKHSNWYGFDHDKIIERLAATKYLGDVSIKDRTFALYFFENPDLSKGHKHYPMMCKIDGTYYVSALDKEELKKYTTFEGLHCIYCDDVIYSQHRYAMNYCSCEKNFIDGGRDYTRCTVAPLVTIDLLTGKITNE